MILSLDRCRGLCIKCVCMWTVNHL